MNNNEICLVYRFVIDRCGQGNQKKKRPTKYTQMSEIFTHCKQTEADKCVKARDKCTRQRQIVCSRIANVYIGSHHLCVSCVCIQRRIESNACGGNMVHIVCNVEVPIHMQLFHLKWSKIMISIHISQLIKPKCSHKPVE